MNDYRKYLEPATIAKMKNIELIARLVVEGFITGLHRSPYHGFSVEFAEYRQYRTGDEFRHIDWKVYGRTNRYYVKQFEEETNLRCTIAVDSSGSMNFKSQNMPLTKYEYGSYLAAALAYLMITQRDAVGLATYDTKINNFLPPRSKQSYIGELLKILETTVPNNKTGTSSSLDEIAEKIKKRGLVIVISDFFDSPESVMKALNHFRHENHEVIAFQILDPREIDFNFGNGANFKDLETGEEMITQPYHIKNSYAKEVQDFINHIKRECFNHNIDYMLLDTSTPFDRGLTEYLAKRRKM